MCQARSQRQAPELKANAFPCLCAFPFPVLALSFRFYFCSPHPETDKDHIDCSQLVKFLSLKALPGLSEGRGGRQQGSVFRRASQMDVSVHPVHPTGQRPWAACWPPRCLPAPYSVSFVVQAPSKTIATKLSPSSWSHAVPQVFL